MKASLTYFIHSIPPKRTTAKSTQEWTVAGTTDLAGDYGSFRVRTHHTAKATFQSWTGEIVKPVCIVPGRRMNSFLLWNRQGVSFVRQGAIRSQPVPQGLFTIHTPNAPDLAWQLPAKGCYSWLVIEWERSFSAMALAPAIPSLLENHLLLSLYDAMLADPFQTSLADAAFDALKILTKARIAQAPVIPIHLGADKVLLGKIIEMIVLEIDQPMSISVLINRFHISKSKLISLFKQGLGITPAVCINQWRLQKAAQMLEEGVLSIQDITMACGYTNPTYFSVVFHKQMGCSPRQYRKQQRQA